MINKNMKIIFFILSIISGFTELGVIILAINFKMSILEIVGLGLAYQLGNIVPNPIKPNKIYASISTIISIVFLCINLQGEYKYNILFISVAFMASNIQLLRSKIKECVSVNIKRSFRILGFILSPLISMQLMIFMDLIILLIIFKTSIENKKIMIKKPKINKLTYIMIIHQIHYFSYSYFLIIILSNLIEGYRMFKLSIVFILGWITYTSVSYIIRKKSYIKYFVLGHAFLFIILLGMFYFKNNYIIILWICTGFGGGTVFCIKKVNEVVRNRINNDDIVFAENVGHILGVIIGMITYYITNSIVAPILVSSICALIAMLGMSSIRSGKERVYL